MKFENPSKNLSKLDKKTLSTRLYIDTSAVVHVIKEYFVVRNYTILPADFFKHCDKMRNCSGRAILSFASFFYRNVYEVNHIVSWQSIFDTAKV